MSSPIKIKKHGDDPEDRILKASTFVFLNKGLEGATMQEIADEADISRTSLHYYFRNKENLFEAIFQSAIERFVPKVNEVINSDESLYYKLDIFTENYIAMLINNPLLPSFIFNEIRRDPQHIIPIFKKHFEGLDTKKIIQQIFEEILKGNIKAFDYGEFAVIFSSLCVFPFLGKPILNEVFFEGNEEAYNQFLKNRKETIVEVLSTWLGLKK